MPESFPPSPGEGPEILPTLMEQLEGLAVRLAEASQKAGDAVVQDALSACPDALRSLSATVRGVVASLEACRVDVLARDEGQLASAFSSADASLRALAEASQRAASRITAQIVEIDAIEALPLGQEPVGRLRQVAADMHEAISDLGGHLDATVGEFETISQRVAALEPRPHVARGHDLLDPDTALHSAAVLRQWLSFAVATGPLRGPWSLLLIELDRFGEARVQCGPEAAEALLFQVARTVEERLQERNCETPLARYQDAVFAALVRGDARGVADVAEHLRQGIASVRWARRDQAESAALTTTASACVTPYVRGDTVAGLLERGERALAQAREEGGDRVVLAKA